MKCIYCNSENIYKNGNHDGKQGYRCKECNRIFVYGKYTTNYLNHFNVKLKSSKYDYLTRDNYCEPKSELCTERKNFLKKIKLKYDSNKSETLEKLYKNYLFFPNEVFLDNEHYSNDYVAKYYNNCMENYDLNMRYFENLEYDDFNKNLLSFIKKNKFKEVNDISDLCIQGVYILVLDKYKQVYIGISNNIKRRIMSHWNNRKEFDRLVFGDVNTSIISIDSFGPLDTTRIFYKEIKSVYKINSLEKEYVKKFNSKYLLNRVDGGINSESDDKTRNLMLLGGIRKRIFK